MWVLRCNNYRQVILKADNCMLFWDGQQAPYYTWRSRSGVSVSSFIVSPCVDVYFGPLICTIPESPPWLAKYPEIADVPLIRFQLVELNAFSASNGTPRKRFWRRVAVYCRWLSPLYLTPRIYIGMVTQPLEASFFTSTNGLFYAATQLFVCWPSSGKADLSGNLRYSTSSWVAYRGVVTFWA